MGYAAKNSKGKPRRTVIAAGVVIVALALHPAATHAALDVGDVAGEWDSDSGWVVLEASPKPGKAAIAVSGYWIQDTDKKGLIPSGTFHPARRTLEFEFTQSWNKKHGTATFALSPDDRTFKGTWRHEGGEGEWLLRRVRGKTFEAKVDSLVAYAGVRRDGAGGAVMVVEDGKVLLQKGYGYAHIATRKPNTAQTSFELASVAKQFTAAAIMILRDQGRLAFHDDVRKYIPELPVYRKGTIRIVHLLHHTSGLPQYGDLDVPQVAGRWPPFVCNDDFAGEFARQRARFPLVFTPGERDNYNNGGYMLLALIVQRVSGKSFGTFLRDEIFQPLGMTSSWVYESPAVRTIDPAFGYCKGEKSRYEEYYGCPPYKNEFWLCCGGSGVWSSVADVAEWDMAWRDKKLFKPGTIKVATTPWKTNDGKSVNYGFGWNLTKDGPGEVSRIWHNGGGPSFCSTNEINFTEDRSIAVLSNDHEFELYWVRGGIERLCRAIKYQNKNASNSLQR